MALKTAISPSGVKIPVDRMADNTSEARQFTFVLHEGQQGLRSHAMREYWKKRHQQKREEERAKPQPLRHLLPGKESGAETASSTTSGPSPLPSSNNGSPTALSVVSQERQPSTEAQYAPSNRSVTHEPVGSPDHKPPLPGIPAQALTGLNYALAYTRLDPFDTFPVKLGAKHHKLLHHWLTTHATMMFEELPMPSFNPMRDVWFPLDLSNEASFNAIMAHAAAHLDQMHGLRASTDALLFKAEAVRIVSTWLNDPARALSDEVFAAVLRLLTFERYWGTESEWRIHRDGLQRMIEARGGIEALQSNWRLELVTFLVSLMSKPSWFDSSNRIWEICEQPFTPDLHPIMGDMENLHRVRCLWLISFIQDMRTLMGGSSRLYLSGLSFYTAVRDAALLLWADSKHHTYTAMHRPECTPAEFRRLACLFFISVLLQGSMSTHEYAVSPSSPQAPMNSPVLDDLLLLDTYLDCSRPLWQGSVEKLHTALFRDFTGLPDGPQKMKYVLNMTDVLRCMSVESRRGVEKCLLNMLCRTKGSELRFSPDDDWTPDSLLSSFHGI
ncbi:transcriptional regulator family: Fungal Specific TF [Paecilomyces variotii]|nr:transcriptional regulator family: Fungal Specific TF [Paecilomyces variotii]KAJ9194640.1 transcriptional regulator family: Fungal Specific TF [Paecilomyces variotii]KAJ9246724.1 transcriptional regulator family: Fungal Specific TF [Paecilomyces variotii]KAJ9275480.1 transcriptional regulator family: Fungal Specific TF [Paecilomyces variotii]KAJ9284755.1 transcriptional regulator family: Fungal Specific TF [Paecilomyces variotii]